MEKYYHTIKDGIPTTIENAEYAERQEKIEAIAGGIIIFLLMIIGFYL
jgi:hypothetical protein